jgi:hypothetical protein
MNLAEIIQRLDLTLLTDPKDFSAIHPEFGYASDLLSCVIAGAPHGGVWVTLQAHANVVAVASLLELSAVIITEGAAPDEATIQKANAENISLFSTPSKTFHIVGALWEMGLRSK